MFITFCSITLNLWITLLVIQFHSPTISLFPHWDNGVSQVLSSSAFGTLTFHLCSLFWIKMTDFVSDYFIWTETLDLCEVSIKETCARVTSYKALRFYFYKKSSGNFTWISADLSIAINNRWLCTNICVIDVLRVYNMVAFCFPFFQVGKFVVWKRTKERKHL